MVQTRLAIIDLATGDQPLYEPGGAALIANGEIYNYLELRSALGTARSAALSTQSDCELPLHLYRQCGLDFAAHLRGMYAIALHDPSAGHLILTRDPFGIKPLYYAETPRAFAFASEPGALIEAGIVAPQLVRSARNELVQMQFTTGRETIFAGINRVLPGEMVVVRRGRIVERRRRAAHRLRRHNQKKGRRPGRLGEVRGQRDAVIDPHSRQKGAFAVAGEVGGDPRVGLPQRDLASSADAGQR